MSVFHCFEDAFSFLPGGKNLMFQGGYGFWFQVSGFRRPLTFSPCDRGSTRRGRGYDINGKRKTEN